MQGFIVIDTSECDPRLKDLEILVACDVDNPLCGERGASAVFGPQKGATPEMVRTLDAALHQYGVLAGQTTGRSIMEQPGAGAAGGLGAGLLFFTQATLRPRIEMILDAVNFSQHVQGASFVLTGEGHTDAQTACGKAPVGVAVVAKQFGIPVMCLSGGLGAGYEAVFEHGIDAVASCPPAPMTLEACMQVGELLVTQATERLCRAVAVGCGMYTNNYIWRQNE